LTYAYDALNRMSQKAVPESATHAAGYSVFYAYDLRGLETEARFGSANGPGIANAWDGFGRLAASATNVDGTVRTLTSSYDAEGNRIALIGDAGAWGYISASSYDGLDRLAGLNEAGHPMVQIGYDAAGRRLSLGLGFDAFPSSAVYLYDPAGRLQTLTHHLAGNVNVNDEALTFDYNPAGQIVMRTSSNNAYASNRALVVDRTYAVNGLNQYTGTSSGGAPSAAFQYDANGNLISDGSDAYVYDAENRLVSATGGHTATLSYDPLGRLWQVASPSGTTRYDGDRLVLEYDGAGTVRLRSRHGHRRAPGLVRGGAGRGQPPLPPRRPPGLDRRGRRPERQPDRGQRLRSLGNPQRHEPRPVRLHRPGMAPRARHVVLQSSPLLAHARPVPADRSGGLQGPDQPICLCGG
jgi:YD repeat-containing protein